MELKMQAIEYHKQGLPVFPVNVVLEENGKAGKYPLIREWEKTTVESFDKMDWSKANAIGLVTGKVSGTIVLDLDLGSDISGREMPPTACQKTGSGGKHYFYKYKDGINNRTGLEYKIDVRADGGFVVIAPSWHPKGKYEWILPLFDTPLAEAPKWLIDKIGIKKKHDVNLAFGAPEGTRNSSAASVLGHILNGIHPNYWVDFGLGGLREWNKRNSKPLPDDELVRTFKSIAAIAYANRH